MASDISEPLISNKHPEDAHEVYSKAGFFSLATFSWLNPLLLLGSKRTLKPDDVPRLMKRDRANANYHILYDKVQSYGSLARGILAAYGKQAIVLALINVLIVICSYVGPYFLDDLVQYLGGRHRFAHEGLFLVSVFVGTKVVDNLLMKQWILWSNLLGLRLRSALTAMVYSKGLRLAAPSRQKHASGDIVNYMAVDVRTFQYVVFYMNDPWVIPLHITLGLLILYRNVGLAALAALVASVACIALTFPFTKLQENFEDNVLKTKDTRMRAATESLRSMRILKLQAWEEAYMSKLQSIRKTEYGWIKKTFFAQAANVFISSSASLFVGIVTFGVCALLGTPLSAGKVLSTIATLDMIHEPLERFPVFLSAAVELKVSLGRLARFLAENELEVKEKTSVGGEFAIEIEGGNFSWNNSEEITLSGVDLQIKRGTKVAVCGPVGCGKSSLICCLLGEIPKHSGKVSVQGSVAYVSQSAWIQSGTIQENVLFGKEMDKLKYDEVLAACQLTEDLDMLPHGDQTVIGERGINLSGGQKQRVQLARAVYQDADIYLLDDPFSALDVTTGLDVFKECILQMLAKKTVVLVTHQLDLLPSFDLILVLKLEALESDGDSMESAGKAKLTGRIVQSGNYKELFLAGLDFGSFIASHAKAVGNGTNFEQASKEEDNGKFGSAEEEKSQLVQEEEREEGKTRLRVYWAYSTAVYKGAMIPLILVAYLACQGFKIAGNWWMTRETPATSDDTASVSSQVLVTVYSLLMLGGSCFVLIQVVLVSILGLLASQKFFHDMLFSIFHAPISFFDSTPTGRILTRASTDQKVLDLALSQQLGMLISYIIQFVCNAGVIVAALWQALLVLVPAICLCIPVQNYYMASARELNRLTGTLNAPIFDHFSESIAGAATIRAFGQENRFMKRNLRAFDTYSKTAFYYSGISRWMSLRLELLTNAVFTFCLVLLVNLPSGTVDPSLAGLAVTYGLNLSVLLGAVIWFTCDLQNKLISVERILQYSNILSEAPWTIDKNKPPECWPSEGTLEIQSLQVRYRDESPLVLRGITCTFPGGKKVGVIGRTGSGKSTLVQAIFRLVEPVGGKMMLDGVNICNIGLHELRSRLSIIPQEPTLFEGTVRYNLDSLQKHSDAKLWEVLDKCQLGNFVRSKDAQLDSAVSENGENWSVGQRQLLCLGRVMLKTSRLVVLDEATASVDIATDELIQSTIRTEFKACTVITIAHRLATVMDSDLVLVLNNGCVMDYDTPSKIMQCTSVP